MRKPFRPTALLALVLSLAPLVAATSAWAESWKFGVMADTQWKADMDGENPDTVAVGIIEQLNAQFISHGVKFVIQVGDLVDKETNSPNGFPAERTMGARAAAAQSLYDAGIGFFPLRGNHEGSQAAASEFQALYPQATGNGQHVFGARNFCSPFPTLDGLSYSFDYKNARFMLLDQFTRTDGTNYLGSPNNNILDQQAWVATRLSSRRERTHAFVFSHKNLIGQNHVDVLFGSDPASNPDGQNALLGALFQSGVRYHMGGHDHMHNRAIVTSPDGTASVQDIIAASDSYKFYIPAVPSNDERYDMPAFGFAREAPVAQELFTVGYYIFTVDGPRVTVDYYASANGCDSDCDLVTTPVLTFAKRESFGYSLNGREFLVSQGDSYTVVEDRYGATRARILDGVNGSTSADYAGRPFTKAVDTGWTRDTSAILVSDVLTLWGMSELGSDETDTYTLSLGYDHRRLSLSDLAKGALAIATETADGRWVNAAEVASAGAKRFVWGPWQPGYELGTYGVDPHTRTAWAVINFEGRFGVARHLPPAPRRRE